MILIYSSILVLFLAIFIFVPDIMQMQDQDLGLKIRTMAADRLLTKHVWVWPAVFVLIGIIAVHSFRSFWRVVGPLYRFRVVFEQVRNGDLSYPIKIRDKDYLHQEEQTLNGMLGALAEKLEIIQQTGEGALKSLVKLEEKASEEINASDTHKKLLNIHRRHLEELVETARYFHLKKAQPKAATDLDGDPQA
jgi:methyl-accepting chemotaxis protein